MAPSFSGKNGVRYRFYVSTALRGRKHQAGSVTRVAASEIEGIVSEAVRQKLDLPGTSEDAIVDQIERIILSETIVRITLKSEKATASGGLPTTIEVPWTRTKASHTHALAPPDRKPDQKLLQAVVRAHAWLAELKSERFSSIEELATTTKLHPKVVRQALRLAFLSPGLTSAILEGNQPGLTLRGIPQRFSLLWTSHL